MYGVRKYDHFVPQFRELLLALMELEPSLATIPYPDHPTTKTSCPFSKDCSMLSNTTRIRTYVDQIYAADDKSTIVKWLVGHDTPSAAFNSLEFSRKADEFDGEVRICTIQASTVVTAGYLLGSRKTMDDIHWSTHYNVHPRLLKMDVQVKTQNVPDPSRELWSPKNQVPVAHILCSKKMRTTLTFK